MHSVLQYEQGAGPCDDNVPESRETSLQEYGLSGRLTLRTTARTQLAGSARLVGNPDITAFSSCVRIVGFLSGWLGYVYTGRSGRGLARQPVMLPEFKLWQHP